MEKYSSFISSDVHVSGSIIWWIPNGDADLQEVNEALASHGLADRNMGMTQLECLYEAGRNVLRKHTRGDGKQFSSRYLLRPLDKKEPGFAVVKEEVGAGSLGYKVQLIMVVDHYNDTVNTRVYSDDTVSHAVAEHIQAEYMRVADSLTRENFDRWFSYLLKKHGGAIEMGDGSHVYFIPKNEISTWKKIVDVVSDVTSHEIFTIDVFGTSGVVECVKNIMVNVMRSDEEFSPYEVRKLIADALPL